MKRQVHVSLAYAPLFPYLAAQQNAGLLAEGELVIDNFAGIGGASQGMEAALGRPVDHAINHDPVAVSLHRVNHPHSHHSVEDVWQVHPLDVTGGQPVALCWFSPDCKDFSKAKGGTPVQKHIRGLAWVAVRWAATARPRVIMLENVEEFQQWGPLRKQTTPSGKVEYFPDMTRRGRTFGAFVNALRRQGYQVEWRELRACDYGTPTIRKRLFLIARRDGLPIVWPAPTHAAPGDPRVKAGVLQPYRTAASCIDWDLPCPSIFDRKRPLVRNTLNRVAQGLRRFVLESAEPFIVNKQHQNPPRSAGVPLSTITTNHNKNELVVPHLSKFNTGSVGQIVQEPIYTITTGGTGAAAPLGLCTAHLVQHNGGSLPAPDASYPVTRPTRTVMAQGGRQDLVSGALIKTDNTRSWASCTYPLSGQTPTIVAQRSLALTAAHLTAYYGRDGKHDDSRDPGAPMGTVPTVDRFSVTAATLMRQFGTSTGADVQAPAPTVMTEGAGKTGVIAADCAASLDDAQLARAQQVAAFLGEFLGDALTPYLHGGLVVLQIRGEWYVLADIGMRMLTPRELARCQGFPESYVLETTAEGQPISKARQVRGIGNSVCPQLAQVLTHAQLSVALEEAAD